MPFRGVPSAQGGSGRLRNPICWRFLPPPVVEMTTEGFFFQLVVDPVSGPLLVVQDLGLTKQKISETI